MQFLGKEKTEWEIPAKHNSFIYTYKGDFKINGQNVNENTAAVLEKTDTEEIIIIEKIDDSEGGLIVLSGLPIEEKIVQYGPFVMNSQDEIQNTFKDYSSGSNGFENASTWNSEIQNLRYN